jgi:outer membrane lipoprotein-sorting protein
MTGANVLLNCPIMEGLSMHLLAALAVFLQDKTAEETFKKIEEMILNARAVSVRFKCDLVTSTRSGKEESKFSGTLFLKNGDKLNLTVNTLTLGKEETRSIVSDGDVRRFIKGPTGGPFLTRGHGGVVKGITKSHATDLARIGVFRMLDLKDYRLASEPEDPQFRAFDFGWGEEDKATKSIKHKVKFPGMDQTAEVELCYDPKTYNLIKRIISFETAPLGTSTVATETYQEFTLNADIPNEKFTLPPDK